MSTLRQRPPGAPSDGRSARRQRGVSMIELLVSFVIFSFGMLGMAGLQSKMLAYSQSSLYRSQAAALTDDVLDRMRVDITNARSGYWNTPLTTAASAVSIAGGVTGVVTFDLADWKRQVEALLPRGQASISVAAGVVTVTVRWDDSRAQRTSSSDTSTITSQFVTTSQL